VVISYLPVGSEMATKWYVEQVLEAGALHQLHPGVHRIQPYWQKRFEERGLPIIGDDIKSQVGATITHRMLANLFRERGVRLDRTYQLNFGGNTDFMNMLERERLESKKISKTNAVTSQLDYRSNANRRMSAQRLRPLARRPQMVLYPHGGHNLRECAAELRTEAGSLGFAKLRRRCDRCGALRKLALDRGIGGALTGPSSYFMKTPPQQFTDYQARELVETFINDQNES
jgi:myo-inositol-1-phosphate synthase